MKVGTQTISFNLKKVHEGKKNLGSNSIYNLALLQAFKLRQTIRAKFLDCYKMLFHYKANKVVIVRGAKVVY